MGVYVPASRIDRNNAKVNIIKFSDGEIDQQTVQHEFMSLSYYLVEQPADVVLAERPGRRLVQLRDARAASSSGGTAGRTAVASEAWLGVREVVCC